MWAVATAWWLTSRRCCVQEAVSLGSANQVLPQVFNLAYNSFSGAVPAFMAEVLVPNLTQSGVKLLVSCSGHVAEVSPNC